MDQNVTFIFLTPAPPPGKVQVPFPEGSPPNFQTPGGGDITTNINTMQQRRFEVPACNLGRGTNLAGRRR